MGHGERIGLIAGNGRFPIIFAENAKKQGYAVSAVAHEGETDPELAKHVDRIHWIKIGQFNKLINALKGDGVRQAVMLGGISKTHVFTAVRPDFRARWRWPPGWRDGRTTTSSEASRPSWRAKESRSGSRRSACRASWSKKAR